MSLMLFEARETKHSILCFPLLEVQGRESIPILTKVRVQFIYEHVKRKILNNKHQYIYMKKMYNTLKYNFR